MLCILTNVTPSRFGRTPISLKRLLSVCKTKLIRFNNDMQKMYDNNSSGGSIRTDHVRQVNPNITLEATEKVRKTSSSSSLGFDLFDKGESTLNMLCNSPFNIFYLCYISISVSRPAPPPPIVNCCSSFPFLPNR